MVDVRFRAFLLALYFAALGLFVMFGAGSKLTLKGKLYASESEAENGLFFIDPEGDSESISFMVNAGSYLSDYLKGTVGSNVVITIEPVK